MRKAQMITRKDYKPSWLWWCSSQTSSSHPSLYLSSSSLLVPGRQLMIIILMIMFRFNHDDGNKRWRWSTGMEVVICQIVSPSSSRCILICLFNCNGGNAQLSEDSCGLRNLESSMSEGGWGIDDESKSKRKSVFYLTFSSLLPSRCSKVIPPRMQYPTT